VRYVGVDLAWGQRGVTGLAVLDESGCLLDVTVQQTDDDILAWLHRWTAGPCFVAFDAPIIVNNATGHRACERLISQYYGRFGASCHAANTTNPSFTDGSRALRLIEALDLSLDPIADRRAAEVYPHPAIVTLFDLPRILQYKSKPGRDFNHLYAEMLRLAEYIESLADASPPLQVKANPAWQQLRQALAQATRKADLKRAEDALDSVICAYIAAYASTHPTRVRHFGDPESGQILAPVTPTQAARYDQTAHPADSDPEPPSSDSWPRAIPLGLAIRTPPFTPGQAPA
jgi:predicted RNase H-like nuclease